MRARTTNPTRARTAFEYVLGYGRWLPKEAAKGATISCRADGSEVVLDEGKDMRMIVCLETKL